MQLRIKEIFSLCENREKNITQNGKRENLEAHTPLNIHTYSRGRKM